MKKIYPSFLFMVIISITLWSCNQIEPIIAEENAIASLDFSLSMETFIMQCLRMLIRI